jgi:hypothetical protein
MVHSQNVCLVSPLHDPEGRITDLLKLYGEKLVNLYSKQAAIGVTPKTTSKTVDLLESLGFKIQIQDENTGLELGDNYRLALKLGLKFKTPYIHLLDFDRALHWAHRFPNELRDVINYIPSYSGFLSFIRTRRAFESHPLIQRTTETTVNAIASEVAKTDVDIMSGSFAFDRKLAEDIVKESKRKDFGIYAEFLMVALKNKAHINTMEVEGLEWETPDQFKDKIEQEGYSAWLNNFESLPEWEKRVKLIENSTDVLT